MIFVLGANFGLNEHLSFLLVWSWLIWLGECFCL